jgi:hypothetical protein
VGAEKWREDTVLGIVGTAACGQAIVGRVRHSLTPLYCTLQQWTAIILGNRAEKEQGGCLANSSGNHAVWIHNTQQREGSFCCYKQNYPLTTSMKEFKLQKLPFFLYLEISFFQIYKTAHI